jgi:Tol biopolymer transport system component
LTQGSSDETGPAWSPDGGLIAFARDDSGGGPENGLFVIRPDGSGERRLTGARDSGPVWSPDGAGLAFTRTDSRFRTAVAVMPVIGGPVHLLTGYGRAVLHGWSRTGTLLYTVASETQRFAETVFVVRLDGSERRRLTSGFAPAFSPDGERVAFLRRGASGPSSWVVGVRGGPARQVFRPGFEWGSDAHAFVGPRPPLWSPDGAQLAVSARTACNGASIWLVTVRTGAKRWLTNDCRIVGSPRGDRIAGTSDRDIVYARGGDDRIDTNPAGDRVLYTGRPDADFVVGGNGDDRVRTRIGNDRLDGGPGNDHLDAGRGFDRLLGGPGRDVLSGGPASDLLFSLDGERDILRCGAGVDAVVADRLDSVARDCERVSRR